jgi:hypothetical protein
MESCSGPETEIQNSESRIQNPEIETILTAFLSAEQECRSSSALSGVTSCICSEIDCATFSCLKQSEAALPNSRSGTRRNGHRVSIDMRLARNNGTSACAACCHQSSVSFDRQRAKTTAIEKCAGGNPQAEWSHFYITSTIIELLCKTTSASSNTSS